MQILIKNQWNDGKPETNNEFVSAAVDFFLTNLKKESAPFDEQEHFDAGVKFLESFTNAEAERYLKLKENLGYDLKAELSQIKTETGINSQINESEDNGRLSVARASKKNIRGKKKRK